MRRFLYFLPGVTGANQGMLADRGILSRFADQGGGVVEHAVTPSPAGPDAGMVGGGRGGCIVAVGIAPAAFDPGQVWVASSDGKYWVGIEDASIGLPGPADLARAVQVKGYTTALGGHDWKVPLLRRWNPQTLQHESPLPKAFQVKTIDGPGGGRTRAVLDIVPAYAHLDRLADDIFTGFVQERARTAEAVFVDAVGLLAVNYRIGIEEAGLLGLLDTQAALHVLSLAVDYPALQAQASEWDTAGLEPGERPGSDPTEKGDA